jgi:hypothetical protein
MMFLYINGTIVNFPKFFYCNCGKIIILVFLENNLVFFFLYLIFLSFYTLIVYHYFFSFFLYSFGKEIFFIFTLWIFITLHITYLYHFYCSYHYSFVFWFFNFFLTCFFLKKQYYTKTNKILFHSSNCNIISLLCSLKISLRFYLFLLTHVIFTMF